MNSPKRPGTGELISIIDPVTEEQLAEFTDCGAHAVNDAVARAKAPRSRHLGRCPRAPGPRHYGGSRI